MTFPTDLPRLPPRRHDSHKGDYGRALLIGGSRGMSGAIALAGIAALRGGAGLVKLAVPEVCLDVIAGFSPCYMTAPLPCDAVGRPTGAARGPLSELVKEATCIACGPGLGRSDDLTEHVLWLYRDVPQPMVFDADALSALASIPNGLAHPGGPRILTPHPGEFQRLTGGEKLSADEQAKRAVALAKEHGIVVLLKGHRTLITDGIREVRNTTGNPGMATGGSGDVLTGIITALVCQGLPPFEAAQLGAHLHGLAGDLAAASVGQVSMIARDLLDYLPQAIQTIV